MIVIIVIMTIFVFDNDNNHHYNNYDVKNISAEAGFGSLQGLVRGIRNARAEYNVEAGRKIAALIRLSSSSPSATVFGELLSTEGSAMAMLARLDDKLLQVEIGVSTSDDSIKALGQVYTYIYVIVYIYI